MITFSIKIADVTVQITVVHEKLRDYCQGYLTDSSPLIRIESSVEAIEEEREKSINNSIDHPHHYSDDLLEFLSIHRRLSDMLTPYSILMIHGSSIVKNGEGYLFLAGSGVGKSTHVQNWIKCFGNTVQVINDDKPYVSCANNRILICGSPWNGKERIGSNIKAPLKYVVVLERGLSNEINWISAENAYISLLQHAFFPKNEERAMMVLKMLTRISNNVDFFKLSCNMEHESAIVAYTGIQKYVQFGGKQ